jgi:hypothetical protein
MKRSIFLAACLALVALAACVPTAPQTGTLTVLGAFTGSKSILPPISMDAAQWHFTATGPQAIDVVLPLSGGSVDALLPGDYTATVYAQNAAGDNLGETDGVTFSISYGQTTTLSVAVLEYESPDGALHSTVQWEPSVVADPVMSLSATDTSGLTTLTADYTLNLLSCTGLADITALHPGWWTVTGMLRDGTRPSSGFAAAVRIAAGRTTTAAIALHALQTSGGLALTFSWTGHNELQVTGTPAPGDLPIYSGTTVPMLITSPESGFTVTWYVNGVQAATGAAYTLDAGSFQQNESYRLDAVAISADKQRAASLSWNVVKSDYSPAMLRVSGTVDVTHAQFPLGSGMMVTLTDASGASLATFSTTNGGTYSFETVAPGQYGIKVRAQPGGSSDWSWWNSGQGKVQGATPPELITIPQAGGVLFNFTMGIGG